MNRKTIIKAEVLEMGSFCQNSAMHLSQIMKVMTAFVAGIDPYCRCLSSVFVCHYSHNQIILLSAVTMTSLWGWHWDRSRGTLFQTPLLRGSGRSTLLDSYQYLDQRVNPSEWNDLGVTTNWSILMAFVNYFPRDFTSNIHVFWFFFFFFNWESSMKIRKFHI